MSRAGNSGLTLAFLSGLIPSLWCPFSLALDTLNQSRDTSASSSTNSVRSIGTVKSISGNSIVLKADSGSEVRVVVEDSTRTFQLPPGQTDLKSANPL